MKPKQRQDIVNEIIASEQSYVMGLQLVKKFCIQPILESQCSSTTSLLMDRDTFSFCFDSIITILHTNQSLMQNMLDLAKDGLHAIKIGKLFCKWAPVMNLYTEYLNDYDEIVQKLKHLIKTSGKFQEFMREVEACFQLVGSTSHTFLSFMITPVQRLPRYRLLLQELLSLTPQTHDDYDNLKEALAKIENVVSKMNEAIKVNHRQKKMIELCNSIQNLSAMSENLMSADREYVREGKLYDQDAERYRTVYLFNDMLLVCSNKKKKYLYHYRMDTLPRAWVRMGSLDTSFFVVTCENVYSFKTKTRTESIRWLKDINKVFRNLEKSAKFKNGKRASLFPKSVKIDDEHAYECIGTMTKDYKDKGVIFKADEIVFLRHQKIQKKSNTPQFVNSILSTLGLPTKQDKTEHIVLGLHAEKSKRKYADSKKTDPIVVQLKADVFREFTKNEQQRCPMSFDGSLSVRKRANSDMDSSPIVNSLESQSWLETLEVDPLCSFYSKGVTDGANTAGQAMNVKPTNFDNCSVIAIESPRK